MTFKTTLLAAAALFVALPAFAETQTVVTKEINADGSATTTTTRYYYSDADANNNGILDSNEFPRFVYHRWDLDGDGFIDNTEWSSNTVLWYPSGTKTYKTYTAWDKNGDGRLDNTEFDQVVTTTQLYDTWDINSDKVIGDKEYAESTFRIYDTNDDGALTLKEWSQSRQ
jgi:hypothetical protein